MRCVRKAHFSFFSGIEIIKWDKIKTYIDSASKEQPQRTCAPLEVTWIYGWGHRLKGGRDDRTVKGFLYPKHVRASSFLCLSGSWVICLSVFLLENMACWSCIGLDSNSVSGSGESASGTILRDNASFWQDRTSGNSMHNMVTRQSCGEGDLAVTGGSIWARDPLWILGGRSEKLRRSLQWQISQIRGFLCFSAIMYHVLYDWLI